MRKIGLLAPEVGDAGSWYRGAGPFLQLGKQMDIDIRLLPGAIDAVWPYVLDLEGVIFTRAVGKPWTIVGEDILKLGKWLWVDIDDNVYEVEPSNMAWFSTEKDTLDAFHRLATQATVLSVTTPQLRTLFKEHNKNTVMIPNGLDLSFYDPYQFPERTDGKFVVAWRGSQGHVHSLYKATPAILRVAEEHPDIVWQFGGFISQDLHTELSKKNLIFKKWERVPEVFLEYGRSRPDVHMVVQTDSSFNRCRSNIAWLEATHAGALTVAPDWEQWQQPGVLNYSSLDGFEEGSLYAALSSAITMSKEERKTRVQNSNEQMRSKYSLEGANSKRVEVLKQLQNYKASMTAIGA